ncbi:zinc finger, CCHC-type containing protein [Tanacetum coccineum]
MFEKEKLSGNNFNDWFARLKLVLRVEKKMHVIEQPLPPAPEAGAEPTCCGLNGQLYMMLILRLLCPMLGEMVQSRRPIRNHLKQKAKNKVNGKGKDKKVYVPKPNNPKPTAKERPAKDDACHHCKEVGHWKRTVLCILLSWQKKKEASCFCQGFRIERKLKQERFT